MPSTSDTTLNNIFSNPMSTAHHVFMSYAHADGRRIAEEVEAILLGLRAHVDRDSRFLELGCRFAPEIIARIRSASVFVAVLTRGAVESRWVAAETGIAFDLGKRIVPLLVNGVETPDCLLPYIHGWHSQQICQPLTEQDRDTLKAQFARVLEAPLDNPVQQTLTEKQPEREPPKLVTNDEYLEFLTQFGRVNHTHPPRNWCGHAPFYSSELGGSPVTDISWEEAQAFCDWRGCRLMLQDEINWAACAIESGACTDVWVDGGTFDEKVVMSLRTAKQSAARIREYHAPHLGFAAVPVTRTRPSAAIWVEGCESLPTIELPTIRRLADGNNIPHAWFSPVARATTADAAVSAFRMSRDCVTNIEYWEFVQNGGASFPRHWSRGWMPKWKHPFPPRLADSPVVNIGSHEAQAYARWKNASLPSFAQRRWAVQFGHGGIYPWGSDFIATRCNGLESDRGDLARVDEFELGTSSLGIRQLCGNNWEWTLSPDGKPVLCGGSYRDPCEFWSAASVFLDATVVQMDSSLIGFRLVFQ